MSIKLIIFDLDGTLVDSLADLTQAANHMLCRFGRPPLDIANVRKLVGQGARRLVERALPGADAATVEEGLRLFLTYNEAHIADRTTVYPGVREALPLLADNGRALAVVSNKHEALCRTLLATFGIDRYFPLILGADSTPFRKPAPEPLLAVMERCGARPEETVMVGDSINDIAAGKAAGVVTVGCSWGYAPDELADADCRIDAFADLAVLPILAGRTP